MDSAIRLYLGARFGTAVSCMDGRCIDTVQFLLKGRFGVHHVDTITEPGMVGQLAAGHAATIDAVRRCLDISVHKHFSSSIAVVGHHDCAGNPVPLDRHLAQIRESCALIRGWGYPASIIGLYVNELWQAEEICSIPAPEVTQSV